MAALNFDLAEFFSLQRVMDWMSQAWTAGASFVGPVTDLKVAVVTAVIAYFAIIWPLRYQRSAALLDQAVRALERSYDALTADGATTNPIKADRLSWLTAARNIETYKALKKKIPVKVYRRIAEDHEEYWRLRFYVLLGHEALHQPSYYGEWRPMPRANRESPIAPESAVIVHAFAKWREGREDPVDLADFHRIFSETDPRKGNPGLRHYLDDPDNPSNRRFRNLMDPYPKLTWCDRRMMSLGIRSSLRRSGR